MGALTLKTFPFELRSWDIEKFLGFDLTDSFGSMIKIYTNKNLIIQVEPSYNSQNFTALLNDKGRQYFDSILTTWSEQEKAALAKKHWSKFLYAIILAMYVFDHCWTYNDAQYFFTFVVDHSGLEVLDMLVKISQNCSCVALKSMEHFKENVDLEQNFQLNRITEHQQLDLSSLCLLMVTHPKHEGYCLHLKLRQRFLKGNFKCLAIGSLIDLTFPISFLGSNLSMAKTMSKGNQLTCQDLRFSKKPLLIYSNSFLKRMDSKNIVNIFRTFSSSNKFNGVWSSLCKLNSSLSDVGTSSLMQVSRLRLKDLNSFSSLYFVNAIVRSTSNLKKITELKLLNNLIGHNPYFLSNKWIVDQSHKLNQNKTALQHLLKRYLYLPQNTPYESEHTFINVEGFLKKTNKLVKKQSTKKSWHILRKFIKQCKNKLTSLTIKESQILFFNSKKLSNFKRLLNLQYCAIQSLTRLNYHLTFMNKTLKLNSLRFNTGLTKTFESRVKLELDDFFLEGRDLYSRNSTNLNRSSKNARSIFMTFYLLNINNVELG